MRRIPDTGIWEIEITPLAVGQHYKYSILGQNGVRFLKADPYAVYADSEDSSASAIYQLAGYPWQDAEWISQRREQQLVPPLEEGGTVISTATQGKTLPNSREEGGRSSSILANGLGSYPSVPLNIYEVHLGSWRRHPDGTSYSYLELAESLLPYLVEMNYTHLEILPLMEHPHNHSWGYQTGGFYAATSRYGTPQELMAFIDRCHQAGIGVILDWTPAHFPKDTYGLMEYDGSRLYEAPLQEATDQEEWGTRRFNYASPQVQSFLISNAIFWLELFHADALRIDAVSSIIYQHGHKNPNHAQAIDRHGIAFLQALNKAVGEMVPGALIIAEEETSWPLLTKPYLEGGLGFSLCWNTAWVADTMAYAIVDPIYRHLIHEKVTLPFYYCFNEHYLLTFSHDLVVNGKGSFLEKMPGSYDEKFAGARAFLGYMMAHPGKKLQFMGTEIASFREWDAEGSLEWFLLDFPLHQAFHRYVRELNLLYKMTPALWCSDNSWNCFQWISWDDRSQNIIIFIRRDSFENLLVVLVNFAPVKRASYRFGVPQPGHYQEILSSDHTNYGGSGVANGVITAQEIPFHDFPYSIEITVPPLATVFFKLVN